MRGEILLKSVFSIFVVLMFQTFCLADVLPAASDDIPIDSIGVYQTDSRVTVYEKPDSSSKILYDKEIIYKNYTNQKNDDMFAVILPKKTLGYLYAVDTSDDENWVKVIYDKNGMKTGWVCKNDDFQFMPWLDFISVYGRKYGIAQLKSHIKLNNIYSNPDENAQVLGQISHPKVISLTAIEGNWFLVTILNYSGETVTGYIIWRTDDGNILLFPNIK